MTAALKAATRQAVAAAGGALAVAHLVGVSAETARRWGDANHPEYVPLRYVPALEAAGPSVAITRALAQAADHVLVPLADAPCAGALAPLLMRLAKESADVFEAGVAAISDGQLSREERARVLEQALELDAALRQLRRHLEAA